MAPTIEHTKELIYSARFKTFTLKEACEFIELLSNMPAGIDCNIQWINAKTKEPVAIGYNY